MLWAEFFASLLYFDVMFPLPSWTLAGASEVIIRFLSSRMPKGFLAR